MNREQKIAVLAAAADACPDRLRRARYLARAHVLIMAAENGPHCNQYEHDPNCPDYDPSKEPQKTHKNTSSGPPVNATQKEIKQLDKKLKAAGITDGVEVRGPITKAELEEAVDTMIEMKQKHPNYPINKLIVNSNEETRSVFPYSSQESINNTQSWTSITEKGVIHLNGDIAIHGIHKRKFPKGVFAGDGSVRDFVMHEIGHLYFNERRFEDIDIGGHVTTVDMYFENCYIDARASRNKKERPISISEYADWRYREYFAEMFVLYSKDPSKLSPTRQTIMKNILNF